MVRTMREVTDPEILAQLNGAASSGLKEVTDLAILAQLNGNMGFTDRVKQDYANRMKNNENIAEQYVAGNQSYPSTLLQFGGQGAAFAGDVGSEGLRIGLKGLRSIAKGINDVTPDFIREPIKQGVTSGLDYVMASPVARATGDAASSAANYAIQKYKNFEEKYPVAARNAEALVNIGLSLTPSIPIKGKSLVGAAESVGKEGVNLAKEGVKKAASPLIPTIPENAAEITQLAKNYNIPVSLPQVSDSRALANIQKVSQELPFSGSNAFRDKQLSAWQSQLLDTVGVKGDKFSPSVMEGAFKKVGNEFDGLTKGKTFGIANSLSENLARGYDEILSAYGKDAATAYEREGLKILNDFEGDFITGEKLASQRARINSLARKASGNNKLALRDLENVVIDGITSNDPAAKEALSAAKEKYKNLIAIEPLAQKAKKGFINPTLLNNRISKVYGRSYTTGNAGKIGDLARIGYELLGEAGGSDTTQKLLYTVGATGGGLYNAPITAGVIAGNRALQSGLLRNQGLVNLAADKAIANKEKRISGEYLKRLKDQTKE